MRARLFLLLIVLGTAPRAFATTAADLCAPAAEPCVVPQGTAVAVSNGSIIDLGDGARVLASGLGTRLDAGAGTMSIIARSVTLNPGSALLGRTINVTTSSTLCTGRSCRRHWAMAVASWRTSTFPVLCLLLR